MDISHKKKFIIPSEYPRYSPKNWKSSTSWRAQVKMPQPHLGGRREQPFWGEREREREGTGWERRWGKKENIIWYWVGQKVWSPEGQEKEWKQAHPELGVCGGPSRMFERPVRLDSQDIKGGNLNEIPYSGEKELVEPTSIWKMASSEGKGCYPIVKILTHNCCWLKELRGWKWRRPWGKKIQQQT